MYLCWKVKHVLDLSGTRNHCQTQRSGDFYCEVEPLTSSHFSWFHMMICSQSTSDTQQWLHLQGVWRSDTSQAELFPSACEPIWKPYAFTFTVKTGSASNFIRKLFAISLSISRIVLARRCIKENVLDLEMCWVFKKIISTDV